MYGYWTEIAEYYNRKRNKINEQMKYISGNGYSIGVLLDSLKDMDECIERFCKNCEAHAEETRKAVNQAKDELRYDSGFRKQIKDELLNDKNFVYQLKSANTNKTIKELKEEIKKLKENKQ